MKKKKRKNKMKKKRKKKKKRKQRVKKRMSVYVKMMMWMKKMGSSYWEKRNRERCLWMGNVGGLGNPETTYHPARSGPKEHTKWGPQPVVVRVGNAT